MSKTILLADDSVTIQKVVELTFMDEDYEIVAVSDGDAAIGRLGEIEPSLVIADVHMPGAGGYEVSRKVKEQHPAVPVLLLVGTFEPFDEGEAKASGADLHLKKPFDSQELLRLVEELIDGDRPTEPFALSAADGGAGEAPAAVDPPAEAAAAEAEAPALDLSAPSIELDAPVSLPDSLQLDTAEAPIELGDTMELSPAAEGVQSGFGAATPEVEAPTPEPEPEPEPPTAIVSELPAVEAPVELSDGDVDRIARRVIELLGDQTVREVSWEVVPDLAEVIIKERVRELESQVD